MARGSRLPVFLALFLLLAFPDRLLAQKANALGKIIGMLRVSRADFPDHPVLVYLEMRGSPVYSVYADGQGRFGFYGLIANDYTVIVNDDAFEPFRETINVNPETNPTNILSVTLTPRSTTKKDPLSGRVEGSNPYLIDPTDYARKFPKKTRKEFDSGVEADHAGKTDEAIEHYKKALGYSPDFYPAHNNLGSAYLARREFDQAQAQFEEAIKANQNDAQAHLNLANVFLLTQRNDQALFEIEEGLKRQPNSAFGHFLRGSLHSHDNHPEPAEKDLLLAIELDPKMSQAYLQLVNLYVQQKRTPDAIAQLETYLKAFPDSPYSPKARELLKRLQPDAPSAPK